ncbi:hypothetical protein IGI04_030222 [Brassica rapa subsp. trilocularis]|uniref:Uncharacterized protein n=1 Tax=Brassica rapa subsp. trilocularis TaxID=1813537 RepID=A0ABQ7LQ27_BRACM|nr:hypothetical protein IGI04_030222 [Brassica rapa subsp. trilocularis]
MQGFSNKYLDLQIGQVSMNQVLMVVATKSCSFFFLPISKNSYESSLDDCRHEVAFEFFFCWNPYEASLNEREIVINLSTQGFAFQTYLKNLIPCIPSPKTSSCVKFSVGGQLWFLQKISVSVNS